MAMGAPSGFASLDGRKYLCLETFKKDGTGVRTPVWFAADPAGQLNSSSAKLYIYTVDRTGKVKRIRNSSHVRVAPCDTRGNVQGDWIDARAQIVNGPQAEQGMRLLNKKYWPMKQILAFFALFSPGKRLVIAISPA
jgi:uncharacterized protein